MEHIQSNPTIINPKDPVKSPSTTMSVSALPAYANYDINILCGPYAQPFFVHFFLGDVPKIINYEDPYDIPSWAGQNYIIPTTPARASQAATAQASPAGYTREFSADTQATPESRAPVGQDLAQQLPSSFTKFAVRSSQPFTDPLVKRFNVSGPAELQASDVREYLQHNLHWRLVGAGLGNRHSIAVDNVPIRMWVVKQDVKPPSDPTQFPVYGATEVLWNATRGKLGGLHKGELPGVG
ncbi:MAG: hypothetical protein M1830_010785 [Pleopsidium flavum]|nr:MAG: hypothetical protein M1830_010785 [Pleopsidium flavum]